MKTTRRSLLYGLGGALVGATALSTPAQAVQGTEPKKTPPKVTGMALTLGISGVYHPSAFEDWKKDPARPRSLLTVTDLDTGHFRQQVLEMPDGHHAMRLGTSHRIVCIGHHNKLSMVVDEELATQKIMVAPDGYVYGGHGYVDEPNNVFVLPARIHKPRTIEDQGIMEIYDLDTLKKIDQVTSGGIHPHEIRLLPNGKELVVTHYGDVALALAGKDYPYHFNVLEPKLTVYDAKTLKPLRDYVQEDLNAILTHMDLDDQGNVFAVSNQYIPFGRGRSKHMIAAIEKLKELTGDEHNYELNPMSREENRVATPLPLLRINPQTGEVKKYYFDNGRQRRSQSVAYQPVVGKVFATYAYSNTVVTVDKNDKADVVDCFQYGLSYIRGVDPVPGTPYMLLSDTNRGIAMINAETMELVRLYDVPVYRSPHVRFDLEIKT